MSNLLFHIKEWLRMQYLEQLYGRRKVKYPGGITFWWDEKAHLGIYLAWDGFGTFSLPYGVVVGACEINTPADHQEYLLCHGGNIDWQNLEYESI